MTVCAVGEPRVRMAPVAYGFGPVGKALHVARAVRARMGDGVTLELSGAGHTGATAEPGLFDAVTPPGSPAARADLVVSVMNRAAVALAAGRGEPVLFLDSLAWLWDGPLAMPGDCVGYLYQDLPLLSVPAANVDSQPGCRPIGGITGEPPTAPSAPGRRTEQIVLSLSGLENFENDVCRGNVWYAQMWMQAVRTLEEEQPELAARVVVHGNPQALAWAGGVRGVSRIGSGLQEDYLRDAANAAKVLIPPGLTSIVELLHAGVPFQLLPPQNYSQLRIAQAVNQSVLDVAAQRWESQLLDWLAERVVPEPVGSQAVRNTICERMLDGAPDPREFAVLLESTAEAPGPDLVRSVLGPGDGADTVAAEIERLVG
ncbi:hypothetical protein GCM10010420_36500 [Streptomyces glaucosporus]|uniref:Uncharacterized protein n=1 Tax=Streptomyces glaucosporus TaxID=284044 RepID=A0ABN3IHX9_9ACTN